MKNKFFLIGINQTYLIISYLIVLYLADHLSVDEFGTLVYFKNILAFSGFIIWFGLDRSSLHLFKKNIFKQIPYINAIKFNVFVIVSIGLFLLVFFSVIKLSIPLFLVLLFLLFTIVLDIKYVFDITDIIYLEVKLSYLKILPVIFFILLSYSGNYNFSILNYFSCLLFGSILYVSAQYNYFKILPFIKQNLKVSKIALTYSKFVWIGGVGAYLYNYTDSFMIMKFLGAKETGIYTFAYTFYFGLIMVTSLMVRFFVAETLNSQLTLKITNLYSFKMLVFSSVVAMISYWIFPIFVNNFFKKYTDSIPLFNILLIVFIFISISSIYGNILVAKGYSKYYAYSMLPSVVLNILFNYIFIPIYGSIAAAIVTLVSTLPVMWLSYYFYRKKLTNSRHIISKQ